MPFGVAPLMLLVPAALVTLDLALALPAVVVMPVGVVGTVMVVSVVVVAVPAGLPAGGGTTVTSVALVPARSAFTNVSEFSFEPARLVKLDAILPATSAWPLFGSVVEVCAAAIGI